MEDLPEMRTTLPVTRELQHSLTPPGRMFLSYSLMASMTNVSTRGGAGSCSSETTASVLPNGGSCCKLCRLKSISMQKDAQRKVHNISEQSILF